MTENLYGHRTQYQTKLWNRKKKPTRFTKRALQTNTCSLNCPPNNPFKEGAQCSAILIAGPFLDVTNNKQAQFFQNCLLSSIAVVPWQQSTFYLLATSPWSQSQNTLSGSLQVLFFLIRLLWKLGTVWRIKKPRTFIIYHRHLYIWENMSEPTQSEDLLRSGQRRNGAIEIIFKTTSLLPANTLAFCYLSHLCAGGVIAPSQPLFLLVQTLDLVAYHLHELYGCKCKSQSWMWRWDGYPCRPAGSWWLIIQTWPLPKTCQKVNLTKVLSIVYILNPFCANRYVYFFSKGKEERTCYTYAIKHQCFLRPCLSLSAGKHWKSNGLWRCSKQISVEGLALWIPGIL